MPVHPCEEDGKPGYQWGGHGKCYTYTPNNDESKKAAHAKAVAQGQAAHAHGYKSNDLDELSSSLDKLGSLLNLLKNESNGVTAQYYSTAKPFYRFEYNLLQKEIEAAGWNQKPLLIDIKCDGLRLTVGKVSGKTFAFVDPESLKDKSPDISERLPLIMQELQSIQDNTILDGEFIAIENGEVLHRTVANALLNSTNFDPKKLEGVAHVFIFDVLFFGGQDIRVHPLHERVEYLGRIQSTPHIWVEHNTKVAEDPADGHYVDGNDWNAVKAAIDMIFNDKTGRPKNIAEGVMIKTLEHPYEFPTNHGWGKCKKHYEVDCVVWNSKLVKGQNDVFNYFLGINIDLEYAKNIPKEFLVIKRDGKYYLAKDMQEIQNV